MPHVTNGTRVDSVDRSGRSSDEEMEKKFNHYNTIRKSLEVLMEQCKNLVKNMNAWSESNKKIGEQLNAFVASSPLIDSAIMEEYRVSVMDFHTMVQTEYKESRRAVTAFLQNRVISVIEQLLKEDSANVEAVWKVRKNILLDYESHLRRASNYEQKKDMEQMNRFELKASHDQTMLEEHTRYLNQVFDVFTTAGSDFLLFCTSSFLTCELFLVKQQFESLASICNNVGEETVSPILDDINGVLSQIRAGKAVEQASAVSLPFHLPPKEAIPKYVPFREYVKMENVEKKVQTGLPSISDGEMDGAREVSGKEEAENSDVFGFLDGGEGAKGESQGDDVFGELMGVDGAADDDNDDDPFGIHGHYGEAQSDHFGDDHDQSDDHSQHDFFAKQSPLDDLFDLGGGTVDEDYVVDNESEEELATDNESEEDHVVDNDSEDEPATDNETEEEPTTDDDDNSSLDDSDNENEESSSEQEYTRPSYPRHVIARASFEGDDPEDLSFEKGDILTVLKVSKSGWWKGKLHGRVGIFPATYVRRYD